MQNGLESEHVTEREGIRVILLLWVLGGVTLGLFGRTAFYSFINYDDWDYVVTNPNVLTGLTLDSVRWAFTTGAQANWHPLTWLSYQLDVTLFGASAGAMHLENAAIHSINVCLLFLLFLQLTGRLWAAAWVAAMFAWHPLRVESVAWVSERKDVLCGLFMLLALLAYVRYVESRSRWSYILTVLLFVLALLAKPMAVTLPCVMLLLDFWPLNRLQNSENGGSEAGIPTRPILEKLPFFALAAASSAITLFAQRAGASVASVAAISMADRIFNALMAYAGYLRMTFAPYGLAIFYPHPSSFPGGSVPLQRVLFALVLLFFISALAWRQRRRMPWVLFGWLWYLGMLFPVIGVIQVGNQSMADRYTYIPLIGVYVAIAFTCDRICSSPSTQRALGVAAIVSSIVAAMLTWRQISTWRDTESVMRHAIAVVPNNYVAHASLGQFLAEDRDDLAGGVREYHAALNIDPDNSPALYGLAKHAASLGNIDDALRFYERGIRVDPSIPAAHNNYGRLLLQKGRVEDAIRALQAALAADPGMVMAYINLADAYAAQGRMSDAATLVQKGLELARTNSDPAAVQIAESRKRLYQPP